MCSLMPKRMVRPRLAARHIAHAAPVERFGAPPTARADQGRGVRGLGCRGLGELGGDRAQGLFESRRGLAAGDQVAVIDDHGWDRIDSGRLPSTFGLPYFIGITPRRQDLTCGLAVKASGYGGVYKHLMIGWAATLGEVGVEKSALQLGLAADDPRPVQQSVSVEGVVDAALVVGFHREPHLGRSGMDGRSVGGGLLGRRPVFFADMLDDILPLGRHVWIEFEGLKMNVGLDQVADLAQGFLKPT